MKEAIYNFFKVFSKVILFFKRLAVKIRIKRLVNSKLVLDPNYNWKTDAEVAKLITLYYRYDTRKDKLAKK